MINLDTLKKKYCQYQIQIHTTGEYFEFIIMNPYQKENISVDNSSGIDQNELTFRFSYQHAHFGSDIDALMRYIDAFLLDSEAAIEFFRNGKNAFGGSISFNQIDVMSADDLSRRFGYKPAHLIGETYNIRTWSGKKDMNGEVAEENGRIYCRKISEKH